MPIVCKFISITESQSGLRPLGGYYRNLGAMSSKEATGGTKRNNMRLTLDILELIMKSKKKPKTFLDVFNSCFETYTNNGKI